MVFLGTTIYRLYCLPHPVVLPPADEEFHYDVEYINGTMGWVPGAAAGAGGAAPVSECRERPCLG